MQEVWKEVKGYENLYQISNLGNVKSLNYKGHGKTKILKLNKNKFGYFLIRLTKNKTAKSIKVHRLVAKAFIPNPDNLPQVNHKDENKTNNEITNLEWCDNKYNCNYGTHSKRVADKLSKKVYQYTKDRSLVKIWNSVMDCGRNGFDSGHVSACCKGERKTHKGYIWVYDKLKNN